MLYEVITLYDNPVVPNSNIGLTSLIGILLPLNVDDSGNFTSSVASEILDGIKIAVSEFNEEREDKIGIVIRDTKNDADVIDDIRYELGNNENINVITSYSIHYTKLYEAEVNTHLLNSAQPSFFYSQ